MITIPSWVLSFSMMVDKGGRVSYNGRSDEEWETLIACGLDFLVEVARRERTTSYTELNAVLVRRTGLWGFDFEQESERAAMGHLLGEIVARNRPSTDLMISALVLYLNENDAGRGFYSLAEDLGVLPRNSSRQAMWDFWVTEVARVHDYFGRNSNV